MPSLRTLLATVVMTAMSLGPDARECGRRHQRPWRSRRRHRTALRPGLLSHECCQLCRAVRYPALSRQTPVPHRAEDEAGKSAYARRCGTGRILQHLLHARSTGSRQAVRALSANTPSVRCAMGPDQSLADAMPNHHRGIQLPRHVTSHGSCNAGVRDATAV